MTNPVHLLFQSERLLFRELMPSDAQSFYDLNSDPEVLRYTGDDPFSSLEKAAAFLTNYDEYDKHGYGRWAVIRKTDKKWIGWCGLKWHAEGYVDLGYRFFQKYWGMGHATEAAMSCVAYAREELSLPFLVGRTSPKNIGSIRVLEKIGMKFWKKDMCNGIPNAMYYKIEL